MDLNQLYYNYNQCTGGSLHEFNELTLGEVLDIVITYVNNNSDNKNNKKEQSVNKGEKETYFKVD